MAVYLIGYSTNVGWPPKSFDGEESCATTPARPGGYPARGPGELVIGRQSVAWRSQMRSGSGAWKRAQDAQLNPGRSATTDAVPQLLWATQASVQLLGRSSNHTLAAIDCRQFPTRSIMAAPTSLSPNFCELPVPAPVTLCHRWRNSLENSAILWFEHL